jgi:hypothetical protein
MGDDSSIVQVELVEEVPKALRQLPLDLVQVLRILLGAPLDLIMCGVGDVVILRAESLQEVWGEVFHGSLPFTRGSP